MKMIIFHYNMDQLYLPINLEVHIPSHHVSRIVNQPVEELDNSFLYRVYDGGGGPPYHPKFILKVILYAVHSKSLFLSSNRQTTQESSDRSE